jgi:hypothetical protein
MKILPVQIELFHAEGRTDGRREERQTDMTKLMIVFRNFANALKNAVSSAQKTFRPSLTTTNRLMLLRLTVNVHFQNNTKL